MVWLRRVGSFGGGSLGGARRGERLQAYCRGAHRVHAHRANTALRVLCIMCPCRAHMHAMCCSYAACGNPRESMHTRRARTDGRHAFAPPSEEALDCPGDVVEHGRCRAQDGLVPHLYVTHISHTRRKWECDQRRWSKVRSGNGHCDRRATRRRGRDHLAIAQPPAQGWLLPGALILWYTALWWFVVVLYGVRG